MAYKTFLELQTDALRQVDETIGSGSTTARAIIKSGINESYSEIASLRNWKTLENSAEVTTVSGTQEYTPVASAFGSTPRIAKIQSVLDETNSRFLQEVKREVFEQTYPYVASTDTGDPLVWYVSGYTNTTQRDMKIKLYKVPDSELTLRVVYYEEPLEMQSDDTIPRIPDEWHYGLNYIGIAKYYEFQKDPAAGYYRDLHEQFKRKILDAEFNETDEMPEFRPQGRDRGIITGKIGRIYN